VKLEDFTYVVESQRSAREALVAVWKAAEATGWVIVGDYDLSPVWWLSPVVKWK